MRLPLFASLLILCTSLAYDTPHGPATHLETTGNSVGEHVGEAANISVTYYSAANCLGEVTSGPIPMVWGTDYELPSVEFSDSTAAILLNRSLKADEQLDMLTGDENNFCKTFHNEVNQWNTIFKQCINLNGATCFHFWRY